MREIAFVRKHCTQARVDGPGYSALERSGSSSFLIRVFFHVLSNHRLNTLRLGKTSSPLRLHSSVDTHLSRGLAVQVDAS
ncbi:hypothetical protein DAEQUDRAFT_724852 [Daedalea quercina L-15889]|uniref:Uncharacterized protein n=1 Tax=Daedalea quercina L-15889 TaxID=1314783 RepID=A0A165RGQ4_9APHY|nr:hypothetical protein DAEQUDRAFT_724852 [Daedalea quercina L-15889]